MRRWIGIIVGVLASVVLGGAWYFSGKLLYPKHGRCNLKYMLFCGTPAQQKLAFEKVSFQSQDGLTLRGWWIPASNKEADRAVVLVHGRGGSRHTGMRYAPTLHAAGFHLLAFDMRRAGKSDDAQSTMGYHEQKDVSAAIDYVHRQRRIKRIGVQAFSMGAVTSLMVMAKDKRILAGVFEGAYADATDVVAFNAKRMYGLPRFLLTGLVRPLFNWRGNASLASVSPEAVIASIAPRPVYLIHHERDPIVPYSHGKRLFKAAKSPKQFWSVPGRGHTVAWQRDTKKARQSIRSFFLRAMPPTSAPTAPRHAAKAPQGKTAAPKVAPR